MQFLIFVAYVAVGVFQAWAGTNGMQLYFGAGAFVGLILFVVCFFIPLVGGVIAAVAVFYGARYGWHWEWWQAVLLAVPGIVLSLALAASGGLASVFSRRR